MEEEGGGEVGREVEWRERGRKRKRERDEVSERRLRKETKSESGGGRKEAF